MIEKCDSKGTLVIEDARALKHDTETGRYLIEGSGLPEGGVWVNTESAKFTRDKRVTVGDLSALVEEIDYITENLVSDSRHWKHKYKWFWEVSVEGLKEHEQEVVFEALFAKHDPYWFNSHGDGVVCGMDRGRQEADFLIKVVRTGERTADNADLVWTLTD